MDRRIAYSIVGFIIILLLAVAGFLFYNNNYTSVPSGRTNNKDSAQSLSLGTVNIEGAAINTSVITVR